MSESRSTQTIVKANVSNESSPNTTISRDDLHQTRGNAAAIGAMSLPAPPNDTGGPQSAQGTTGLRFHPALPTNPGRVAKDSVAEKNVPKRNKSAISWADPSSDATRGDVQLSQDAQLSRRRTFSDAPFTYNDSESVGARRDTTGDVTGLTLSKERQVIDRSGRSHSETMSVNIGKDDVDLKRKIASTRQTMTTDSSGLARRSTVSSELNGGITITLKPFSRAGQPWVRTSLSLGGGAAHSELTSRQRPTANSGAGRSPVKTSALLSGRVSASLTCERRLDPDERIDALLAQLETERGTGAEFALLASCRQAIAQKSSAPGLSALLDAATTKAPKEGQRSEIALEMSAGLALGGSVMGFGLGGSVKGSIAYRLALDGGPKGTVITLSMSWSTSVAADGSVCLAGIDFSHAVSSTVSAGTMLTSRPLDAAGEDQTTYAVFCAVRSLSDLEQVIASHGREIDEQVSTSASQRAQTSALGGFAQTSSSSSRESSRVKNDRGAIGSTEAGEQSTTWTLLGVSDSESAAAKSTLKEDGIALSLTKSSSTTSLPSGMPTLAALKQLSANSALRAAFLPCVKSLERYSVDPADVNVLITERAPDLVNWGRCAPSVAIFKPWKSLRRHLLFPTPDPALVEEHPEQAKNLGRMEAIAEFFADYGTAAHRCVESALRRWGEDSSGAHATDRRDLGSLEVWPTSIQKRAKDYASLGEQVKTLSLDAPDTDGLLISVLLAKLERLLSDIMQADDFQSPRPQSEMCETVSGWIDQVEEQRWQRGAQQMPFAQPELDKADAEDLHRLTDSERERRRSILALNKTSEEALLTELEMESWSEFFGLSSPDVDSLNALRELYELWPKQVIALRELLAERCVPQERWPISGDPSAARSEELEPNFKRYRAAVNTFMGGFQTPEGAARLNAITSNY